MRAHGISPPLTIAILFVSRDSATTRIDLLLAVAAQWEGSDMEITGCSEVPYNTAVLSAFCVIFATMLDSSKAWMFCFPVIQH